MATFKQVHFIETLMREREMDDLYDSLEAQSVRCGQGENLSVGQASAFINQLLSVPKKAPKVVSHEEFLKIKAGRGC